MTASFHNATVDCCFTCAKNDKIYALWCSCDQWLVSTWWKFLFFCFWLINFVSVFPWVKKHKIDFMTTFTLGRFQSYLFRDFNIARIKMGISPFIFEYDPQSWYEYPPPRESQLFEKSKWPNGVFQWYFN